MKNICTRISAVIIFVTGLLSIPHTSAILLNDNSRINETLVAAFEKPKSLSELQSIIQTARIKQFKVAVAGKRHSQGGQSLCKNGVVIDINGLNKIIDLDVKNKTITVEPGVTWEQIQEHINPHGLSVIVMQASNIFTVGGSLSVNCHGRDPHYGQLIETVRSCKVLLADGTIVTANRTENAELFSHVIGGYGLFGIIIEATLDLTDNVVYQKHAQIVTTDNYAQFFNTHVRTNNAIGLHFGRIILHDPFHKKWDRINAVSYHVATAPTTAKDIFNLQPEKDILRNKLLLQALRTSPVARALRIPVELNIENNKEYISRNNAMRPPIACLDYYSSTDTDILQEYFVPCDKIAPFVKDMQTILEEYGVNILNITIRFVPKSTESVLSYATEDSFAFVLYINHKTNAASIKRARKWTQKLIDAALSYNGNYYLPYSLYATKDQITRAYPNLLSAFAKKLEYDPQGLFSNTLYTHYS